MSEHWHTDVWWRHMLNFMNFHPKNFIRSTGFIPDEIRDPLLQRIRDLLRERKDFKTQYPTDIPTR